jgi:toxin YoeB
MRTLEFSNNAFDRYVEWSQKDPDVFRKINILLKEVRREPFKGTGKPEPLKNEYKGCWSRRITKEHRLIYKVYPEKIEVLACAGHYE